ncbi:MAG: DedA family protein [Verrucomicrobia bacterium 13_1_20CM_54_28]|nr:MAG: DedA family protein [Verrucomicrobia bacterium 13_1_20CM_54_28]OLD89464.1 MAG: DedA family protein [Verrucomicrobia bacterium 13_1_20CM_4_54_11]OLE11431.1 MAG: DedA family protein [Verrucomicrobia bacterium 13_1_20CM_3_54_17]PYK16420.1 MAG: DedA family protein [Verrucomicrobiota bacterium]
MHHLLETWFHWVLNGGYLGIIVLMAMESSIFPVPSEIVIPPAAFLAAQGKLSFTGVVLAGVLGSYLGSAITYWASRLIGRPLIAKYGRFVLVTPKKLEQAEQWLARYEAGGVFFARLLPVVRHLISIPAGIVRMNFGLFSLVTIAGSALWCWILAYLGDKAYRLEPELLTSPDALVRFIHGQSKGILLVVALFAALYMLSLRLMKPRSSR